MSKLEFRDPHKLTKSIIDRIETAQSWEQAEKNVQNELIQKGKIQPPANRINVTESELAWMLPVVEKIPTIAGEDMKTLEMLNRRLERDQEIAENEARLKRGWRTAEKHQFDSWHTGDFQDNRPNQSDSLTKNPLLGLNNSRYATMNGNQFNY